MNLVFIRGKGRPSARRASLRPVLLLTLALAGCSPGKNMVDEQALEARLGYQSAFPTASKAEFAPTPTRRSLTRETSSFVLGPDDVVRILVLNQPDLDTVEPVRPDGKIAFLPAGDLQAAGRTVEQLR